MAQQWNEIKSINRNKFFIMFKRIRWFHVPLTFTLTLASLGQLRKFKLRRLQEQISEAGTNNVEHLYKLMPLEVSMYKMLPLRTLSRLWGWINSIELPESIRTPVLKSYALAFGCNLNEAFIEDLKQYKNLNEFFRRELKPGLRPIAGFENDVVSPSDGTIVQIGSSEKGLLEQVKGITYSIESFLGPITWKDSEPELKYETALLQNRSGSTNLHYCIIYLAPGDYHRYHSPANWTVKYRRHFPGKLYSVRPTFASWFPKLFSVNERVAYIGEWEYGFFSMSPVGAFNVGSMKTYFDKDLKTNKAQMMLNNHYEDKKINDIVFKKGEPVGEFNLGSTVVLIFEAPKNMEFCVEKGMKMSYGQLISNLVKIKTSKS